MFLFGCFRFYYLLMHIQNSLFRQAFFPFSYLENILHRLIMSLHFSYIFERFALYCNISSHYTTGFKLCQRTTFNFI